jgi:hypothetical protein
LRRNWHFLHSCNVHVTQALRRDRDAAVIKQAKKCRAFVEVANYRSS